MKVPVPMAKNILDFLGITTVALAIDAGVQKRNTLFYNKNFNNIK